MRSSAGATSGSPVVCIFGADLGGEAATESPAPKAAAISSRRFFLSATRRLLLWGIPGTNSSSGPGPDIRRDVVSAKPVLRPLLEEGDHGRFREPDECAARSSDKDIEGEEDRHRLRRSGDRGGAAGGDS